LQLNDNSVKLVINDGLTDNSRAALYQLAVKQRSRGEIGAALATLERLQARDPEYSRLYEERAYCYLLTHDLARAIAAFERSVSINAALRSSWVELERLQRANGDTSKAAAAAEHLATLDRLPAPLVQAGSLFSDGEMASAEQVLRAFLDESGNHVEALRLLARIAHHKQSLAEARSLFERTVALAPHYRAARADYARVLIDQQSPLEARDQLNILLKLEPGNPDYLTLSATVWAALAEHECAITAYRQVLAVMPTWSHVQLLLGHSLKAIGHQQQAIDSYRAAATSRPGFGDAYWSLANLKTYRFSVEEIERMRVAEAAPATQFVDRFHLCFALGKALEDRGDYEKSWRCYERGNALKSTQSRYDPQAVERLTDQLIEICTADFFAARSGFGTQDPSPLFIVGLPRSGSTLIEQILASHSKIEGTQELPTVEKIVHDELAGYLPGARNPGYPAVLANLSAGDDRRLGERYLDEARAYRKGKPLFIDKMPNNFRHIGLIHLMLPAARIIDVRREVMGCCVSNLRQLFSRGQEFSYSSDAIARYYRCYLRLMRHWDEVLPGRVLHVAYEDVVDNLEATVRRMMAFCELQPESACLEFHNTRRAINTASSEQVRQPISRRDLTKWRHFEPWLGPLKEALARGP
jgi:tetratricopeptide (TPR) repeat protein